MDETFFQRMRALSLMDQILACVEDYSHRSLLLFDDLMEQAEHVLNEEQWKKLEEEVLRLVG